MITASNNPFSCSPVLVGNNNAILELGTISRASNTFSFSVGFKWRINAITFQNAAIVDLEILPATTGFKRTDLAVLTAANTIELLSGVESETIALQPTIPLNAIILTSWNVDGVTIEDSTPPLVGTDYVKKSDALTSVDSATTGTDALLTYPELGQSTIKLTNASLVSIIGISFPLGSTENYVGKIMQIQNATGNPVEIKHNTGLNNPFITKDGASITIPNGETLFVKFNTFNYKELFKSWINVSQKLDKNISTLPAVSLPLLDTDKVIVNRAGVDYSVDKSELVVGGEDLDIKYPIFYQIYATFNNLISSHLSFAVFSGTASTVSINGGGTFLRKVLTAATSGSSAQARATAGIGSEQGFYLGIRIDTLDTTNDSATRFSYGFAGTSGFGSIDPSAGTQDVLSLGADASDTNCQIISKTSGVGSQLTKVDLGSNFPKVSNHSYQVIFTRERGGSNITYYVRNITSGFTASGSIVQTNKQALSPCIYRNNGTASNAVGFGINRINIRMTDE